MATIFKTIREYFDTCKEFVIPNYQRGYKWAVKLSGNDGKKQLSAIEVLIDDLLRNFKTGQPYFLQGVTVTENESRIELIDGQQRTTTLYLLLWYLKYPSFQEIKLLYDIRASSGDFLKKLSGHSFSEDIVKHLDENQDIYYFREGIGQIHEKLKKWSADKKQDLCNYLLDKVSIIYIRVERDKAVKTFTMMNGSKATMRKEELVKSEMLRLVSLPTKSNRKVSSSIDDNLNDLREAIAHEWETNALRSRYAREWDKWMQWWNCDAVSDYFGIDAKNNVIGLLLDFYYKKHILSEKFKFEDFASFRELLNGNVKDVFKGLRDLQKAFEDLYNSPVSYNYLKLALICNTSPKDRLDIVQYYIDHKETKEQKEYALWRLVNATHHMITTDKQTEDDPKEETKETRARMVMHHLDENIVYNQYNEEAFRQLLYLNVEQYVNLGEKFNFDIWLNRSLEHIYPKSKVWHIEIVDEKQVYMNGNGDTISMEDIQKKCMLARDAFNGNGCEHCIGNLVLLYNNNNSTFNNADFKDKKRMYFNLTDREFFESRHLLHTISYFAEEQWGVKEIQDKKKEFIEAFKKRYGIDE